MARGGTLNAIVLCPLLARIGLGAVHSDIQGLVGDVVDALSSCFRVRSWIVQH